MKLRRQELHGPLSKGLDTMDYAEDPYPLSGTSTSFRYSPSSSLATRSDQATSSRDILKGRVSHSLDNANSPILDNAEHLGQEGGSRPQEAGLTLDIANPDRAIAIAESRIDKGIKTTGFKAKYNVNVVSLVEGSASLWKGSPGERFRNGLRHHKEGRGSLFLMRFKRGYYNVNKYFVKQDGCWTEIKAFGFYTILRMMMDEPQMSTTREGSTDYVGLTLDITSPDRAKMYCYETSENGYTYKRFTSMSGMSFEKVVDGSIIIWTSSGDKRRALRVRYRSNSEFKMLVIYFGRGALYNGEEYFEKIGREWVGIKKEDYDKRYMNMQK